MPVSVAPVSFTVRPVQDREDGADQVNGPKERVRLVAKLLDLPHDHLADSRVDLNGLPRIIVIHE